MFDKHIIDFNKSILGLREFVDLIEPFLTDKQNTHNKGVSTLLMSGMLNSILKKKTQWEPDEKEKMENLKSEIDAQILEIFKKPIDIEVEPEKNVENEDEESTTVKVYFKSKENKDVEEQLENARKSIVHIELLYKNSLISLLSSVEWFFSQILHYYYDKFPDSAGIQKKTMTLADLKSFGTIEDAEKFLIDTKIEEILRGSFDSWLAVLKSDLSLKLGYIDSMQEELIEIYQRRNLLVHNGGVVNSIYINKVKQELRGEIKAGQTLDVSKAYLDNAICKLQKAFILIASELWKKLDKSDKVRGDVLTDIVYENLLKSRWDICEGLTYFIINDSELDPVDKVVGQLNYWLCLKRTNRLEEARKDLDKVDYSEKKEIFQLGLFAIKEDTNEFLKMLPSALDSGQLNTERLEEFPIFEEIRKTEAYSKFKSESKYFKEPSKPVLKLD